MKLLFENWREYLTEGAMYIDSIEAAYKELGVAPAQTEEAEDIAAALKTAKKAYYKKAYEYHPDRNPEDPMADEKFKKATEAWDAIQDPKGFRYAPLQPTDPWAAAKAQDEERFARRQARRAGGAEWTRGVQRRTARSAFHALGGTEQWELKEILKKLQQNEGIWFAGSTFPARVWRKGITPPTISKSEQAMLINFQQMDKYPYTTLKAIIDGAGGHPSHRGVLWKFVSIFKDKLPVGPEQIRDEWGPFIEWLELMIS